MKYANINWLTLDLGGAGDTWRDINHRKPRGFYLRETDKAEEQRAGGQESRGAAWGSRVGHSRSCGRNGPRRSRYRACGEKSQRLSESRGRGRLGMTPGRRGDTRTDTQEERCVTTGRINKVHLCLLLLLPLTSRGDGPMQQLTIYTKRWLECVWLTVSAPARSKWN